ncbi:MAG: mannose-1-phosphate guanylyltransferase [Myxococcota bacterium]
MPAKKKKESRKKAKRQGPSVHAVILAGGAGERFWPRSRRATPKPLMEIVGGKTLLASTVERAHRIAEEGNVWLVCGHEHARAMKVASGLAPGRVLVEPDRRNTAMAVAWAAQRISTQDPEAVMVVLSADHHIPDAKAFAKSIQLAAHGAAQADVLVTLGVRPTRPETGYGYIHLGREMGEEFPGLCRVRRFVEKPDAARARRYVSLGDYLWNAGVFVWSVSTLLAEIKICAPDLHKALAPLRKPGVGRSRAPVEAAYRRAPSVPIDIAVLERSQRVCTIPVDFAWSDVGTWASLGQELGLGSRQKSGPAGSSSLDESGNCVIGGDVLALESSGNLVWADKRMIALLGVDDLTVIETDDVILITKVERSSDVRMIVGELKRKGRDELT